MKIVLLFLCICFSLWSDVKSTSGQINFNHNADQNADMILNSTGLGIGISPSSNLHVNGNAIVSGQTFIVTQSGSANLNIGGTIGFGYQTVNSDTTISESSVIFADSSSDNILLNLPYAGNVTGRVYQIKKISKLNSVWINGGGNLIDDTSPIELPASEKLASVKVISDGTQWFTVYQNNISETVASENLAGWWKLDETSGITASDSSENNNSGNLQISMSFSSNTTSGQFKNGLFFDGIDDNITVEDDASIGDDFVDGFSISIWIRPAVTNPSGRLLEKGDNYFFLPGVGTGGMNFLVKRSNSNYVANSLTTFNANQWYHLVGTFDGSSIHMYVDGVFKDSTLVGGNIDDDNLPLTIGSDDTGSHFQGSVDDVRIYNYSLTPSEISALYSQGQ